MDGKERVIRELFIDELADVRGGDVRPLPCPWVTTLACGEEQFPCSMCQ
ncbi:MAG TPA: hypothetical protein VHI71_10170 [Actinomycetota bacterium]|nr:hypothetical protein [Actinomycetota bacterium]